MASAHNYQSDQAPDAFKEEEAKREAALRRARNPATAVEFPEQPTEDDLETQLEVSHEPVPEVEEDDIEKMEHMEPEPQRVTAPPPRPAKRHSVKLASDELTVVLEVDEVSIDQANQSLGLLIPSGTDLMPKVGGEFKLTARGTEYDVLYAGARMNIESLGSLLVSFVMRKVEDD